VLLRLEELSQLIKSKRPDLDAALLPGASQKELEDKLGPKLASIPDVLKEVWCWRNGQSQSYNGNFHSRSNEMLMSVNDAIETMDELNENVEVGDIASTNWMDDWLPFTENGGGNYMCVSLTTGEIIYYDKYETSTGVRFSSIQEWLDDLVDGYKKL
jgi:cell wall assembly regulator SMI1